MWIAVVAEMEETWCCAISARTRSAATALCFIWGWMSGSESRMRKSGVVWCAGRIRRASMFF